MMFEDKTMTTPTEEVVNETLDTPVETTPESAPEAPATPGYSPNPSAPMAPGNMSTPVQLERDEDGYIIFPKEPFQEVSAGSNSINV